MHQQSQALSKKRLHIHFGVCACDSRAAHTASQSNIFWKARSLIACNSVLCFAADACPAFCCALLGLMGSSSFPHLPFTLLKACTVHLHISVLPSLMQPLYSWTTNHLLRESKLVCSSLICLQELHCNCREHAKEELSIDRSCRSSWLRCQGAL